MSVFLVRHTHLIGNTRYKVHTTKGKAPTPKRDRGFFSCRDGVSIGHHLGVVFDTTLVVLYHYTWVTTRVLKGDTQMKEHNISIYLRKENYQKYKELTDIMEIPLSSFIAQQLQEVSTMATIDKLIVIARQAKQEKANGKR